MCKRAGARKALADGSTVRQRFRWVSLFQRRRASVGAARFNFTFDFGGGVQIVRSSGRAITIAYKYQHISNGDHSPINLGVDVQMVYGGFSILNQS